MGGPAKGDGNPWGLNDVFGSHFLDCQAPFPGAMLQGHPLSGPRSL